MSFLFLHGPNKFSKKPGDTQGNQFTDKFTDTSRSFANAEEFLRFFARERGYKTPDKLFSEKADERNALLFVFCAAALHEFRPEQIADAIIKWRYPVKILNFKDTSKDQAASFIVIGRTSKVNFFDMFTGGLMIIVDGKSMNGVFSRNTTNFADAASATPDFHYLTHHAIEKELPEPPLVLFAGRCSESNKFDDEAALVVQSRAEFEAKVGHLLTEPHRIEIADPYHKSTIKFRLLNVVWDAEIGKLMVVSDSSKKPVAFVDWVDSNLSNILPASDRVSNNQLATIRDFAKKSDLLDKLRTPRNWDPNYNPWKELLKQVEQCGGVIEPFSVSSENSPAKSAEIYKQAVKIWRYAILQIAVENVKKYEEKWADIKVISEILQTNAKLACDDSRQSGDIKVLGAILTKEEFIKIFEESNVNMKTLRFVPHYKCGFLSGCHQIHLMLERLGSIVDSMDGTCDKFRKEHATFFFNHHLKRFATEKDAKPVELETLLKNLPTHLAQELGQYVKELNDKTIKTEKTESEDRKFVKGLYELFVAPGDRLRAILNRGIETRVLKREKDKEEKKEFVLMSAAQTVYEGLFASFGHAYREKFTDNQINALVIEEVARTTLENYSRWAKRIKGSRDFKIEFFMDNFETGQATIVPERPRSREDWLNLNRADYYLTNFFTTQEVADMDLKGKLNFAIAA